MTSLSSFQSKVDIGTLFERLLACIGGILSGPTVFGGLVALIALRLALRPKSILQDIDGPPAESWLYGNMLQLMFPPSGSFGTYDFPWQERYGFLYRFKGCFGENRLMVSDATALHHMLHNPTLFMHGPVIDNASHLVHGSKAIVTYHDHNHKRLRSVLNTGFTAGVVRGYEPLIRERARIIGRRGRHGATSTLPPLVTEGRRLSHHRL
uniref:Cytochrome P450 n=1 Tax=Mycena chlorophos TaxID=658473 RepID=A0ABQ0L5J9_MYCCL|nr:predicted protein [Mycena chlorophos]